MSQPSESANKTPAMPVQPPHAVVGSVAMGFLPSRCLHAAVELGIPDALGDEPAHARDLADKVGALAEPLSRVMRMLATSGVFTDLGDDRYAHSAASKLLRTDH